ncbi:MAG: CooT family nickel-binding protein [Chloroflexota bacterium]
MCEATVFLAEEGAETKVMENVISMRPEDDQVLLADLLGEQKVVRARVKAVDFLRHRIVLEKLPAAVKV